MLKKIYMLIAVLLFVGSASGATLYFDADVSSDFDVAANWDDGSGPWPAPGLDPASQPLAGDWAFIDHATPALIDASMAENADAVLVGVGANGQLNVTGGSVITWAGDVAAGYSKVGIINVTGAGVINALGGGISVAFNNGSNGTMVIDGETALATTSNEIIVGRKSGVGHIEITEGTLSSTKKDYNGQSLYISSYPGDPTIGVNWAKSGTINITGGMLQVHGNITSTGTGLLDTYVLTHGLLTGYGSADYSHVIADYNVTRANYTTITAVPEPMTIALLGLGGLFLRRRK